MIQMMNIVANIFQLFAVYLFMDNMLKKKYKTKYMILFWIIEIAIDEYVAMKVNTLPFTVVTTTATMVLIVLLLYSDNVKNKILMVVYSFIFISISEAIANVILITSLKTNESEEYFLVGSIISKMVYFLFITIVIVTNKKNESVRMDLKTWIIIMIIPICSIIMIVLMYPLTSNRKFGIDSLCIYSILMLINYVAVIQFLNSQKIIYLDIRNKELAQESKYYLNQCELTNEMLESIRRIKHDIKNQYIVDEQLLNNKKYEELSRRYKDRLNVMDNQTVYSNTGNIYIDSIINYKAEQIVNLGARFECSLEMPKEETISNEDIILIIGNLLDNAMDALSKINNSDKFCVVKLIYDMPNVIISIKNKYNGISNLDKNGEYITTKEDSKMHGIGLRTVKNVVLKYGGRMDIEEKKNIFSVIIHMYE